jgi:hypothetical protein
MATASDPFNVDLGEDILVSHCEFSRYDFADFCRLQTTNELLRVITLTSLRLTDDALADLIPALQHNKPHLKEL